MVFLYVFIIASLCGLAYMRFEAGYVKVERIRLTKNKNCLKILQLSDIHINHLKVSPNRVKSVIDREKPDIVVITGDFIERKRHLPKFIRFLDELGDIGIAYVCLGNHDYEAFKRDLPGLQNYMQALENKGLSILHNKSVCFEKGNKKYNIIGIADIRYGYDDISKSLSSCCSDAVMNIAFTHNPDLALKIPKGKIDYLLCGHFHGGQIWMPFNLEFKVLRDEKLCRMGIRRGLHKFNGISLYISRGLGNVCFPLRFLSRPEITVLYLP